MIKAIFWDNDGTLVDTEALYLEATRQVLKEYGVELTDEFYSAQQSRNNASAFSLLDPESVDIAALREKRNLLYLEMVTAEVPIIEGVMDTLEYFHKKIPMAIVTSSRKVHFDQMMITSGIKKYFDFFITGDDVSNHKPNPEPYLKAIKISGLKPEECLAIEDTERGVIAAKDAGMMCFAVPTVLTKGNDFSRADKVLANVREMIQVIDC